MDEFMPQVLLRHRSNVMPQQWHSFFLYIDSQGYGPFRITLSSLNIESNEAIPYQQSSSGFLFL